MQKTAVILVNMGGPDSLDDVEPYLRNIFSDPYIFNIPLKGRLRKKFIRWFAGKRAPKSRGIYSQIGNRSPLIDITNKQVSKLEELLNRDSGRTFKVIPAMQYWKPFLHEAWEQAAGYSNEIIVVSLYPFYSTTTTKSIIENTEQLAAGTQNVSVVKIIDRFGSEPMFIEAMVKDINKSYSEALKNNIRYTDLLFSAHSIPYNRIKKGDPYEKEIRECVEQMKPKLPQDLNIHLSFQSKVGPVKWLSPATSDRIEELADEGIQHLMVYPLGFVADNSETVYEIDIQYRKLAGELGIKNYCFVEALNDNDLFIEALKKLILGKI